MSSNNLLIIGLGNPEKEYQKSRHNCGADFVEFLSKKIEVSLVKEDKFFGLYGFKKLQEKKIHLCIPLVYVNESGKTVSAIKSYLKVPTQDILVIHDDLDLPLGKFKLKEGGGHGGHNGLRNIMYSLQGDSSFKRLRIGIDHPGDRREVVKYVLSKVGKKERAILDTSFESAMEIMNFIFQGNWQRAMLELHT
tara:strand:+ start:3498 stop:4076 length:579 start_codon:yes stop_codon:yes gene_type:complete